MATNILQLVKMEDNKVLAQSQLWWLHWSDWVRRYVAHLDHEHTILAVIEDEANSLRFAYFHEVT